MKPFKEKLAEAMVGHAMADIAEVLTDALGYLFREADPELRAAVVEEACVRIARLANQKDS